MLETAFPAAKVSKVSKRCWGRGWVPRHGMGRAPGWWKRKSHLRAGQSCSWQSTEKMIKLLNQWCEKKTRDALLSPSTSSQVVAAGHVEVGGCAQASFLAVSVPPEPVSALFSGSFAPGRCQCPTNCSPSRRLHRCKLFQVPGFRGMKKQLENNAANKEQKKRGKRGISSSMPATVGN